MRHSSVPIRKKCLYPKTWRRKIRTMNHEPANHTPIDDFAQNLRTLCTSHRSVSEVCRLTGINRQQFGRYLKGTYRPSRFNLRHICDTLGVRESDLMMPPTDFETLFRSNSGKIQQGGGASWLGKNIENRVIMSDPGLRKYIGWYHSYSYSFGWPNRVLRSLVSVHEHQGRMLSKTIERVKDPIHGARFIYKSDGFITTGADQIFMAEQDTLQRDGFSLRILFRTHRSHVDFLSGLTTGTSSWPDRQPTSARVVLEYLGGTIDTRGALRKCGIFVPSHHNINPKILPLIDNTITEGETTLHATAR
jgi:transcriptional regulator with XRE-family HTH domain